MYRLLTSLLVFAFLFANAAAAGQAPATKKMLVATELIKGDVFVKTVIVLMQHDSRGAMGIVVNRPTEVPLAELVSEGDALSDYEGNIYWGGPVQMHGLRAILKTGNPPADAERLAGSVYLVSINDELTATLDDPSNLRLYIGYAGWAPGQLDRELALGSWIVIDATEERVFAAEPTKLWNELAPREEHRAATGFR
jgi:putative transcriptional regulator